MLNRNHKDLDRLAAAIENPKSIPTIWATHAKDAMDDAHDEIARLLLNFLASSFSLVDHFRRHRKHLYKNHPFQETLDKHTDIEFKTNGLHRFAQTLRNFVHHYWLPPKNNSMNMTKVPGTNSKFDTQLRMGLDVETLKEFDGFADDKLAMQKLESYGELVHIRQFAGEYRYHVANFYEWLWREQNNIHSVEFDELRTEWNRLADFDARYVPDIFGIETELCEEGFRARSLLLIFQCCSQARSCRS